MTYSTPEPIELTQAETSRAMRKAVRAAFPHAKISVRIDNASMYSSVHVSWDIHLFRRVREGYSKFDAGAVLDVLTQGPSVEAVEAVVAPFRSTWWNSDQGGDSYQGHIEASALVSEDVTQLPRVIHYNAGHVTVSPSYVVTEGAPLTDAEWAVA